MKKIIDLHIHTNCSDGNFSPLEIINMAKEKKVSIMAIADHDTIKAYSKELFLAASKNNIKVIKAVEISTKFKGYGVHILGYNVDFENQKFLQMINNLENARLNYLLEVTKKLNEFGLIVNIDELKKLSSVTKAHIAKDVVSNQKNKKVLINFFSKIPSVAEFIENIMNENCPCYVEKFSIKPKEVSNIIKEAGGKVVIAHPVAYEYENNFSLKDIEDLIKEINPWGIESYYLYVDRNGNVINEVVKWKKIAKKYNLVNTMGSDFHNFSLKNADIGLTNTDFVLSEKEIKIIEDLL